MWNNSLENGAKLTNGSEGSCGHQAAGSDMEQIALESWPQKYEQFGKNRFNMFCFLSFSREGTGSLGIHTFKVLNLYNFYFSNHFL